MSSLTEIDVGQVSLLPRAYSRRSKLRVTGPTLVFTIDIMHLKLLAPFLAHSKHSANVINVIFKQG